MPGGSHLLKCEVLLDQRSYLLKCDVLFRQSRNPGSNYLLRGDAFRDKRMRRQVRKGRILPSRGRERVDSVGWRRSRLKIGSRGIWRLAPTSCTDTQVCTSPLDGRFQERRNGGFLVFIGRSQAPPND